MHYVLKMMNFGRELRAEEASIVAQLAELPGQAGTDLLPAGQTDEDRQAALEARAVELGGELQLGGGAPEPEPGNP